MNTWILGFLAFSKAAPAFLMSSGLHLASEATLVTPERELEIFLTASKSPS